MDYRQLGRTGIKVSPLCLGCMMFGGKSDPQVSYKMVDRAIDAGINFLDTANVYTRGKSEEVVGQALKRNGKREHVFLATKVHGRMDDDDINACGNSRRHIIDQCEKSLRRLQVDYIDLYQIHRSQSDIPIDETLRALDDLIKAGKVRYIGTSTFAAWQVVESLWVSKELHLNRFVTEQPPYNILDRRIERGLLPMAQTYGIGIIPWSPLAMGVLSGKYRLGQKAPIESRFGSEKNLDYLKTRLNDNMLHVVEQLLPLAEAKGCTLSQFSLAWCMHQAGITSPIIGPRTMEHLEDNLKATEISLKQEDFEAVDKIVEPGHHIASYYESDFGPSKYHW